MMWLRYLARKCWEIGTLILKWNGFLDDYGMIVEIDVLVEFLGTKLKYKPGIVMGGRYHEHDCGLSRSIGYFLEPLIVLGLFGKKPLKIKLKGNVFFIFIFIFLWILCKKLLNQSVEINKDYFVLLLGITNDSKDPSVDTFRSTTLPLLTRFGVSPEGLELKIEKRGVAPKGGGQVTLSVPIIHNSLKVNSFVYPIGLTYWNVSNYTFIIMVCIVVQKFLFCEPKF